MGLSKLELTTINDLPLWAQIVITIIASGTIGGLPGAYSPILTAQLVYKQKQEENRRTNIGNHMHTLYFPLFNILTKLEEALDLCNKKCEFYQDADEGSIDEFREACLKSIEQISTLLDQGRDNSLTTKLAEHLQSFQKFVQNSIDLELDDGYHESDTALVLIHTPLN